LVASTNFNKLWIGQSISLLGSALTGFALPTLAILVLHANALQVGALSALQIIPFPVLGLFVGVLADRYSRRRIMIAADLVRFAVLATVPLAAYFHALGMAQLYGVAVASGIASAFFGITYQSYLPVIVPREQLPDANVKLEFSNSGSSMAGNALGGALVQLIGASSAIAFDAVSYLASVASLFAIRAEEPKHAGPALSVRQALAEIREGIILVFRSPDLRWILGATATVNFGIGVITAVFLIYAYRVLHLQPGLLGLVEGLGEIGFVGALLAARVRKRFGLRVTLIGSLLLGGLASTIMLAGMLAAPYVMIFLNSAIVAIMVPIYNVNQISYRQALVDVRMQGRLNATIRTFVWGSMPFGAVAGGYLGTRIGAPLTIAVGALFSICSAAWLLPLRERSTAN
jgi:MFS family permease